MVRSSRRGEKNRGVVDENQKGEEEPIVIHEKGQEQPIVLHEKGEEQPIVLHRRVRSSQ